MNENETRKFLDILQDDITHTSRKYDLSRQLSSYALVLGKYTLEECIQGAKYFYGNIAPDMNISHSSPQKIRDAIIKSKNENKYSNTSIADSINKLTFSYEEGYQEIAPNTEYVQLNGKYYHVDDAKKVRGCLFMGMKLKQQ